MSQFSTFPSTISITGNWSNRHYELTSSTSTFIQYELYDSNGLVGLPYGIQFKNPTNSTCTLDVEGSGDLGTPFSIGSVGGSSTQSVASGNSVTMYEAAGAVFTLTVPDFFASGSGGGTGTEGVNTPYVSWLFPNRSCGEFTYVSVTHTEATSSATSYTVHDDTGQIGTILVGTGSTATASFGFTISARTLQVKNSAGSVIGTRVFTCNRKVFCNFW